MTRFARIKGNHKPSFNKVAEESTPWSELKAQREEPTDAEEEHSEEVTPLETANDPDPTPTGSRDAPVKSVWSDFSDAPVKKAPPKKSSRARVKKEREDKIINVDGEEIKMVSLDGFYVTEKDFKVISKLKKKLENSDETDEEKKKKVLLKRRQAEKHARSLFSQFYRKDDKEGENQVEIKKKKKDQPTEKSTIINSEGVEITLTRYQGFLISEHDAKRLHKLKKNLIRAGSDEQTVESKLKFERRKAERYISRQQKKLCFHCRQGGHILTQCPKLESTSNPSAEPVPTGGICYKCGSTEHSLFQCRAPWTELKFASCFICNEKGHLSKSCPQNPRGLYPDGGGCRVCGDVTHLLRDCPKKLNQKKDRTIYASVFKSNKSIEGLDEDLNSDEPPKVVAKKRKNEIIKFD